MVKKRDERDKGQEEGAEIHIDFSFGELFRGLGGLIDLVTRMEREGRTEIRRTGRVKGPGSARAVYGLSVKLGLGGQPAVERFGNVRETEAGPTIDETREPLTDLFEEDDEFVVVPEMPGVEEAGIQVALEGQRLSVQAAGEDRRYEKEVALPAPVDPGTLRRSYRNGILQLRVRKKPSQAS